MPVMRVKNRPNQVQRHPLAVVLSLLGLGLLVWVVSRRGGVQVPSRLDETSGGTGPHEPSAPGGQASPAREVEHLESPELTAPLCDNVFKTRVCSHRGAAQVNGSADGSVAALRSLFAAGVRCFDLDFVATQEHELIVSHPDRLQAAFPALNPVGSVRDNLHRHSMQQVRDLGAAAEFFPSAREYLEAYAALVRSAAVKFLDWQLGDYHRMPLILIDLKGAAFSQPVIDKLWELVLDLAIVDYTALYILDPAQLALAQHNASFHVTRLISAASLSSSSISYQDNTSPDAPTQLVSTEELKAYTMAGPSLKMSQSLYDDLFDAHLPIYAWVVDTGPQLQEAIAKHASGAISNHPLQLRDTLKEWQERCKETAEDEHVAA